MIHTNRIVTVGEQESIIDRPIVLYRGDREVEIEFTLVGNEFTFSEEGNVIKSVNASHGQLVLNTPSGEHMFSELAECHEGKVVFVVTKEMIDEFIEMGFYSFQIRLYDSAEMKSRVTIPPVLSGFDIRNPIAAEDETNVVDQGIVDYARIFKDQSNEELPTFDWQGDYNKTEWVHHDVITENKMNKIEDALYSINANIKESDVIMLNALDNVKKDADKYVKEHMAEVEADVEDFERNLNTGIEKFKIDTNAAMTAHKNEVSEELENVNTQLENVNTQLADIEKYNILKYSNLVIDGDYSNAIQTCLEENSICFLPKGDYTVKSTISIKTGQMLYGAGQRRTVIIANHSNSIVNLDGTGIVISRLTLNRNGNKTNESNGIDIGDSFLGQSRIQDIEIINNRIGLYCGDNTNFYSNVISNIWIYRYTHSAIWLEPFGATGCVFENIYTTNWDDYANKTKIKANTGFFIKNFSECSINQLNIEHTILGNAITTNCCNSIDFGTIHIEGLESSDIYGGVLNVILTDKVQIRTLMMGFSKCYDGIKHWNVLLNNGKNTHIHLEKFIARDNNKNNADHTRLGLCLNNSNNDDISLEIDYVNDKDNLFNEYRTSGYVLIDGGRKHQIKRIGNRVNYNNIGENIETYMLSDLPSGGYWKKGDRIINNSPIAGGYEKYICVESGVTSNIEFGAIVNTTAYQSAITLMSGSIKYNDTFNIDGVNYKATSNMYGDNLINVEPIPIKTLSNVTVYEAKCKFSKTGLIERI